MWGLDPAQCLQFAVLDYVISEEPSSCKVARLCDGTR